MSPSPPPIFHSSAQELRETMSISEEEEGGKIIRGAVGGSGGGGGGGARLDFLEVVPEEEKLIQGPSVKYGGGGGRGSTAAAMMMLTATSPSLSSDMENPVVFHIPESNASDAQSDSQDFYGGESSQTLGPLTSKQQVALWLTRTSMTNLSSVPSLKSLVSGTRRPRKKSSLTPSKFLQKRNYHSSGGGERGGEDVRIERNDSTKSLAPPRRYPLDNPPMRKCETVLTLAASSSVHHFPHKRPAGRKRFTWLKRLSSSSSKPQQPTQYQLPPSGRASDVSCPPSIVGCESPSQGLRPINRLRSKSSIMCSRCTSVLSMNTSRMTSRAPSQMSLLYYRNSDLKTASTCKICLGDFFNTKDMARLESCGCSSFCKECIVQYLSLEISEGAYEISCPDADCEKEGVITLEEIERLVGKEIFDKHKGFRLNAEVALDPNRAWCPRAGCDTICHICKNTKEEEPVPVKCPSCDKEFCSQCSSAWHPSVSCHENGARLVRNGGYAEVAAPSWICEDPDGNIKQCPMCKVPIERNAGCAQMMCKRCKHVFCWYCQTSLDDDFLLRHYDSGQCKGKLGHTRASVLWHRVQVIAILAGFGVFLLVASPLLLIAAPCILCCRCKFFRRFGESPNSAQQQSGHQPVLFEEEPSPLSFSP